MRKFITDLFDLQRFEKNERLEKVIGDTLESAHRDLDEEELCQVAAAGDPAAVRPPVLPQSDNS